MEKYTLLRKKPKKNLKTHLFDKVRQKWGGYREFYCKYYTKNILQT